MFTLIVVVLVIVAMLLWVPLEEIGKWQTKVKKQFKNFTDKINR